MPAKVEKLEDDVFVIDLNNWKVKDFRAFVAALGDNDFVGVAEVAKKAVLQWPFSGDPADPNSYEELSLPQLGQLLKRVNQAVKEAFSEGN